MENNAHFKSIIAFSSERKLRTASGSDLLLFRCEANCQVNQGANEWPNNGEEILPHNHTDFRFADSLHPNHAAWTWKKYSMDELKTGMLEKHSSKPDKWNLFGANLCHSKPVYYSLKGLRETKKRWQEDVDKVHGILFFRMQEMTSRHGDGMLRESALSHRYGSPSMVFHSKEFKWDLKKHQKIPKLSSSSSSSLYTSMWGKAGEGCWLCGDH